MITREELRKQFKKETGTFPLVGARQPYSQHIEWLEDKLIAQSKLKNNGGLGDVSESLSFEGMVINPIDKDGDFEITMNHYNNDAYHYLTTEQAKQLIVYLQQSLNFR